MSVRVHVKRGAEWSMCGTALLKAKPPLVSASFLAANGLTVEVCFRGACLVGCRAGMSGLSEVGSKHAECGLLDILKLE